MTQIGQIIARNELLSRLSGAAGLALGQANRDSYMAISEAAEIIRALPFASAINDALYPPENGATTVTKKGWVCMRNGHWNIFWGDVPPRDGIDDWKEMIVLEKEEAHADG